MKYQDLIILYIPLYIPYVYIYTHNNMLTPPKIRISQFVVLVEKWWLVAPITYSIIYYTFHYILHIYHNNIYIYNRIDLFPYIPYIIYSSIYIIIIFIYIYNRIDLFPYIPYIIYSSIYIYIYPINIHHIYPIEISKISWPRLAADAIRRLRGAVGHREDAVARCRSGRVPGALGKNGEIHREKNGENWIKKWEHNGEVMEKSWGYRMFMDFCSEKIEPRFLPENVEFHSVTMEKIA